MLDKGFKKKITNQQNQHNKFELSESSGSPAILKR